MNNNLQRKTLIKFFGKHVIVEGTYMGRPKKNEKSGWKYEPLVKDWIDTRDNEDRSEIIEAPELPICPIRFPIFNSLVCDIVGVKGFEEIKEKHIIVRHDITGIQEGIKIGDRVELYGEVITYERDDGSVDYGIDVKNVTPVQKCEGKR